MDQLLTKLACPYCGAVMYHQEQDFWLCTGCRAEFWPPDDEDPDDKDVDSEIRQCYIEDLQRGERGGGSRKAGRKREPPHKWWGRYGWWL